MARENPFERIASFYDGLLEKYGHHPRASDQSEESQMSRFRVLAEVLDLTNKRVLDVGCGLADYSDYLLERFGSVSYVGIDISRRMITESKRLRPHLELRLGNILDKEFKESFDVVTANGIFYLLGKDAPSLMRQIIQKMYDHARLAVAFTSLSSWAPKKEPGEFYANPIETMQLCRECTPWIIMRHDYLPHDFTIYMYRERSLK